MRTDLIVLNRDLRWDMRGDGSISLGVRVDVYASWSSLGSGYSERITLPALPPDAFR